MRSGFRESIPAVAPIISYALSGDTKKEIRAGGKKANPADNDATNLYGGLGLTFAFFLKIRRSEKRS